MRVLRAQAIQHGCQPRYAARRGARERARSVVDLGQATGGQLQIAVKIVDRREHHRHRAALGYMGCARAQR
mgnify:CR=1 FL=1